MLSLHCSTMEISAAAGPDIIDITGNLKQYLKNEKAVLVGTCVETYSRI